MIIRAVQEADVLSVVELGARMHAESAYAFLPYDGEKVRRLIATYLHNTETQCGLVAEEGGVVVGMLGGYLADYFFCDERAACDLVLFVDARYRGGAAALRLVRAFREWAAARGARELCLATSTQVRAERTGKFYERLGLAQVGGIFKQRLS
jgi:GNAT superfamily N-acetyltransferase